MDILIATMKNDRKINEEDETPYSSEGSDVVNKPLEGMDRCPEKGCTARIRKGSFIRKVGGVAREIRYLDYHLEKEHGKSAAGKDLRI